MSHHHNDAPPVRGKWVARFLLLSGVLAAAAPTVHTARAGAPAQPQKQKQGAIVYETKSKYSHIRVRRKGAVYTLNFVRNNGREAIETIMNLDKPHHLLAPYTQSMFASYLYQPRPKNVLMAGLGGGAMVRFLQKHDPGVTIDVVEIDPEVVRIAGKYFGVESDGRVNIVTADVFAYLKKTDERYDVIYMDAFLEPSRGTDATGVPLRLKTLRFLKSLQGRLTASGLVVFNLNRHRNVGRDVATLRKAFQWMHVYRVGRSGVVVVASFNRQRPPEAALRKVAIKLDERFNTNFSFQKLLTTRVR